jgi:2-hydroxychromene-2-carboxylate isomerase
MTTTDIQPSEFTPTERAYIRSELDQFFSTFPTVADGIQLRTWRTGERKDQPKLPPAAQSLLARDLVRLDTSGRLPRLFFTAAGLAVLRGMLADKRLADPQKFAHIRRELGIDPRGLADAAE